MSTPAPTPPVHVDRELDLSNTGRGVWLVKVPKYIANKWEKAPGNIEVGKLKISRVSGQKAQVQLSLSEALLCLKEPGEQIIPKEHRLDVSNVTRQSLGVFSHVVRKFNVYVLLKYMGMVAYTVGHRRREGVHTNSMKVLYHLLCANSNKCCCEHILWMYSLMSTIFIFKCLAHFYQVSLN